MREVVCVSCVSCVSAPGPRAAAAQGRGRVSRHLGPGPRPHAGRDLNQVMKNRSSPAIIQSSSLIRFLGPVICERGLKPCPCVLVWMWDQGSLSHTAHSAHSAPRTLHSDVRLIQSTEGTPGPLVITPCRAFQIWDQSYQQFKVLSIFHHSRVFLVVVTTAITLPEF